ncbi:MAG: AraC family transcriptional regulator [Ruminococcaceae bacterium]|nr:AraC family transcriptional regulator [Oscillospiraceae bacterium]
MKSNQENICKFVTNPIDSELVTLTFVYEQNAACSGRICMYPHDTMYLAISGHGTLRHDSHEYELEPGTLFFTFTGTPFSIDDSELTYMYIRFRGRRASELFERFAINAHNCIFPGYSGLITFWQNAIGRAGGQNLDLISESVLLYTFSQMVQPDPADEEALIAAVLHQVETAFTDNTLSLASCAESLGYNPKYISRIFRQNVGCTFTDYLKSIRIRHAVFLIEQGINVVKNVAILSGYSDPLYFSGVFRQVMGISPREYIARKAEEEENP